MKLTKDIVLEQFCTYKKSAFRSYKKKKYDLCLKYLSAACYTAYTFYLGYTDVDIEKLLVDISKHICRANKPIDYSAMDNRVVLYDDFSQDTQGLTMQYLNAIIASGNELLYVTGFNIDDPRSEMIKETLEKYPKASVEKVPKSLHGIARVQYIYDKIVEYRPSRLFMHIFPSAVIPVTAFNALPKDITKYQINITDHTFWVGTSCTDYSFEFRDYGANLSIQYRRIPFERILFLPYYPIMKQGDFAGFPKEANGRIKLFSGSSYYKIIDENDTFFKLNKAILDSNPNAVTLFAGGGDINVLMNLIDKYDLHGKFIPIGQRNDIFECYLHSDIYLSTYPFFGGLMSQYAAHASLPILALEKKTGGAVEEVVCQKKHKHITLPEIEDVVAEATLLIRDVAYRKKRGVEMKECVIECDEFNKSFVKSIETHESQYQFTNESNVKLHHLDIEDKLKLINLNKSFQHYLFRSFGIRLLLRSPRIWKDGLIGRVKSSRFGKYIKKQV